MLLASTSRLRRRGVALVEFAFVSIITMLFLFGIFEYARFVFFLQVANNAAREGTRYAVVRTGDGTTTQNVIDEVTARMASRDKELTGYTVTVTNVNPATGVAISGTTWTDSGFGNAISVRVQGTYRPILPTFLKAGTTINIDVTAMMSGETN